MNFFKRKNVSTEVSLHEGHVAALGEKFARMVSQEGIAHTALKKEHLLWQSTEDTIAVIGWGNTREVKWPEHALGHADDIRVFYEDFGAAQTAMLRFGYVFQLGPVGESIFYLVTHEDGDSKQVDLHDNLTHQWKAPDDTLGLGKNALLTKEAAMEVTRRGVVARHEGDTELAQQCFLRCFIAGLAGSNAELQYSSMMNMVSVYSDERRWLRAFSHCMLAVLLSSSLPEESKALADDYNRSWYLSLLKEVDESDRSSITRIFSTVGSIWYPELLWQLVDYEIARMLGRTHSVE